MFFSVLCLLCLCACLFICTLLAGDGVGAVWAVQWGVLLTVAGWILFCGSFVFFCLVFAVSLCASVCVCFVVTCLGERLGSWLSCVVSDCECHFSISILGQVWYLIVSIPDLCTLTYFVVTCWERADLFALVCGV